MRSYIAFAIALWTAACGEPHLPMLNEVAIWAPGLEVTIDGQGNGRFFKRSSGEKGRFSLTPEQLGTLVRRLEVFRRSSDTIAGKDAHALVLNPPCDGPYVTDNGGITFHWSGPSVDQYYFVDYGCAREKYAARNRELRAILSSLPVPEPEILF